MSKIEDYRKNRGHQEPGSTTEPMPPGEAHHRTIVRWVPASFYLRTARRLGVSAPRSPSSFQRQGAVSRLFRGHGRSDKMSRNFSVISGRKAVEGMDCQFQQQGGRETRRSDIDGPRDEVTATQGLSSRRITVHGLRGTADHECMIGDNIMFQRRRQRGKPGLGRRGPGPFLDAMEEGPAPRGPEDLDAGMKAPKGRPRHARPRRT